MCGGGRLRNWEIEKLGNSFCYPLSIIWKLGKLASQRDASDINSLHF